ncbi:meiotic sister-chromatid recombination aldehyde dehydrogenase [Desarmillaria tabescens]|uniref:Meiotic sister-chromatid recombination aldehyde dehydrogenase n=1 Tax=Armillaria tabescens TaxID=1929756 RepID=A0AA39KEK7_ARMTA|nr:meiotic sister-chromatid recombination aldehyde dehydrogenase [Desarmillaria tabescens]KAK0458471.1 meiotic sister-chromatid recombination aldehyde dehydrogenase [Desarmillaria tabescens]
MDKLMSLLLHPLITLNIWSDDDGIDVFYLLSLFFAFGIWLVFQRYQRAHNSAVPFNFTIPDPAKVGWTSFVIDDPTLTSHETNEDLLPSFSIQGRKYITSFDPATGLHIHTYLADDKEEIVRKIVKADDAQLSWRETSFTQRRRVVRSLLKWLVDNQDVCAKVACRDTGKTMVDAALGEILTTCSKMEWLLAHGEKSLRPERRRRNTMLAYKTSEVHYEPLGTVAGIVSWNYPLHNAWSPILAALFSGNSIVLKCSENVIWSTSWYISIIRSCLQACGHDPEIVQLVCCWPEDADALTTSPLIKHITFIGSEEVGRKVAVAATKHLTPVTLELGGKDPAIIMPGTDLNKWASVWMRGVYQNVGQNCIGIERLIVHRSQYDELFELFSQRVAKLRLGSVMAPNDQGYLSPVDCGAMISSARFDALEHLIREAEEFGNGVHVEGGTRYNHVYNDKGSYFLPTVIGPVSSDMRIAQKELFAPIALIMPYGDVDEAINIANSTRYGLGASVFGPDQRQCLKVAKELDCGMVSINDFGVFYMNQDLPFGGTKSSGYGRFAGPEGLRSLTNPKAIMVDRWPVFIQTSIPKVLDYPIRSLTTSWEFTAGLVRFLYADGWRARIRGLNTVIKASRK